jgi:predicted nucleic acid-binding Zn ribbon protein
MKKVGELLKEYLREKGWLTANPYQPLFSGWQEIAGEALAAHSRLSDVRGGILIVEVDHPGWIQMARLRQEALLAAARKAAPDASLQGIRVVLGSLGDADH